jgi:purine-nucleoside phosphorylase
MSRAAAAIRKRLGVSPKAALVLGSGLGDLVDAVESPVVVPTSEIEGYPASTVSGHLGRLVFGRLEGVDLVIVQGRVHAYEGYSPACVAYPVRLAHALGAGRILLTNAAGGISPHLRPGALMFITDHINVAGGRLGLHGGAAAMPLGARTRRTTSPYSVGWTHRAEWAALCSGIATQRGTYLWTRGPSYETRAEITAFRRLGADAVGMSTVPEALQAAALGMDVLGISTITNRAAGLGVGTLSHEDVLAAGQRVRGDLERLLRGILRELS